MAMSVRVRELHPGMVFETKGTTRVTRATFICKTEHPLWPHLMLVVWKMSDGTMSFDALNPFQDLYMTEWIGQTMEEMQKAWKDAVGLK